HVLHQLGEQLRTLANEAGGFRGLDTSLRINKPELRVEIDRERAADLGVEARDIGVALRLMVGGELEVSRFRDPMTNEQYDVRLRLEEEDRQHPELIQRLRLPASAATPSTPGSTASPLGGRVVELSNVASIVPAEAPSRIDRLN